MVARRAQVSLAHIYHSCQNSSREDQVPAAETLVPLVTIGSLHCKSFLWLLDLGSYKVIPTRNYNGA